MVPRDTVAEERFVSALGSHWSHLGMDGCQGKVRLWFCHSKS